MARVTLITSLFLLLIGTSVAAQVYKWVDEAGKIHYGDRPPAKSQPETVELKPEPSQADIQQSQERAERLLRERDREKPAKLERDITPKEDEKTWKANCFDPSEGLLGPGTTDPFSPVSSRQLTQTEHDTLAQMFPELEGRWRGEIEEVLCFGTDLAPRTESRRYKVDSRVDWDSRGLLKMESDVVGADTRTRQPEVLWWRLQKDWLLFGDRDPWDSDRDRWSVEIVSINTGSLVFIRKFRQRTGPRTSVQRMELRSLRASRSSLTFTELIYTQDSLDRTRTWKLQK